jgi:multicomponent Na+:H+ antiporter subunit B
MGRIIAYLSLVAVGAVLLLAATGLPDFGDPQAPAAQHLSDRMIEGAYHDAHTPNIVTVMIADYRSFDTLGEGIVVFTAGLACYLLLRSERRRDQDEPDA